MKQQSNQDQFSAMAAIPPDDEIDLLEYAKVIWKWRYLTFGLVGLFFVITLAYALLMDPIYKAEVTLLPTEKAGTPNLGAMAGLAASLGLFSGTTVDNPSAVYNDILHSRSFLKEYGNVALATAKQPHALPVKRIFGITTTNKDSLAAAVTGVLSEMIELEVKDNISILSVKSEDPIFSAAFANDLVERLDQYNKEKRVSKIKKNRIFVEQRLAEIEQELKDTRQHLSVFRKRNKRLNAAHAPDLLDKQEWLTQEVRTKQEVYLLLKKEYEMARIEEEKDKPYVQVLDHAIPPDPTYEPSRKLLLAVVIVLACFLGIFLSFVLEFLVKNSLLPPRAYPLFAKIKR